MNCQECNIEIPEPKRKRRNSKTYCMRCYHRIWQRINRPYVPNHSKSKLTNEKIINDINDFVNKIEKRNGMASVQEIFVEMITLFYDYGLNADDKVIDTLSVNKQLEHMWNKLKMVSSGTLYTNEEYVDIDE